MNKSGITGIEEPGTLKPKRLGFMVVLCWIVNVWS